MLLRNWLTNVTQKLAHNCYSNIGLQPQKLTHKCYWKSDPQMLLKNWPINGTQKLTHKRYSKNAQPLLLKNSC